MHWRGAIALSSRTLEHLFKHHFLTFANAQGCCKSAAIVQCDQIISGVALSNSILDYSIRDVPTNLPIISQTKKLQFHSKIDLILRKYNFKNMSKDWIWKNIPSY